MTLHIVCILLLMVSAVICAPGPISIQQKGMEQAREKKPTPQPSSYGTLDRLGGGNLLRVADPDRDGLIFRSISSLDSLQDDVQQNIMREDKPTPRPPSSGTLDPIGGGNLVRAIDFDEEQVFRLLNSLVIDQNDAQRSMMREDKPTPRPLSSGTLDPIGGGNLLGTVDFDEEHIFRLLDSLVSDQNDVQQNRMREDKPKPRPSSSGTLDSLGGGHLLRAADFDEGQIFRLLDSLVNDQNDAQQNMIREDKPTPRPSSSGTLDPIGGGNLVRAVDSDEEQVLRVLDSLVSDQKDAQQNMMREDKPTPRPSSSGTLDSIGGGNLLGAEDSDEKELVFRLLDLLASDQGRQNMMRLAREDKSTQRPSHTLDSIGGGHLLGVVDPYRGGQIYRSLDRSQLLDSLDSYQGNEVRRMLNALRGSDLLSSLDSAEGMAVLSALEKTHTKTHPKRMLDSVSGWAFGESKRNFDEIDNVGFTSFAKKSPSPYYSNNNRKQYSSLAKKNFDEIDRAGFETYNKRNFDEIDNAGFDTFNVKRKD